MKQLITRNFKNVVKYSIIKTYVIEAMFRKTNLIELMLILLYTGTLTRCTTSQTPIPGQQSDDLSASKDMEVVVNGLSRDLRQFPALFDVSGGNHNRRGVDRGD